MNNNLFLLNRSIRIIFFLAFLSLGGCDLDSSIPIISGGKSAYTLETVEYSEIFFWVEVPTVTPLEDEIQLIVLDEVTGLSINPERINMQKVDDTHFGISLRMKVNSIVKYRYGRLGQDRVEEFSPDGKMVRYRLFYVDGPGEVHDIVARWSDTSYSGNTGRISGIVLDATNGLPIPDVMVAAGGKQVLTDMQGQFNLIGIMPGQHHIVAYSIDGSYHPKKQNAEVVKKSATPAAFELIPATMVEVTFNVEVPEDTVHSMPLRLAGNLVQLGNTFSDLGGGVSVLPGGMPQLTHLRTNRYRLEIALPSGTFIQYKYTQGDGFWNAEHKSDYSFQVREILLPDGKSEITINDQVETWQSSQAVPIWFDVSVPGNTPELDHIYIQFQLFGWMSPLPMVRADNNRWGFQFLSPPNIEDGLRYRYCRNAQCIIEEGMGEEKPETRIVATNIPSKNTIVDIVTGWYMLPTIKEPVTILNEQINKRDEYFVAGVAFSPNYPPEWPLFIDSGLFEIKNMKANRVVFTPTWSIINNDPPIIQQLPGKDPMLSDLNGAIIKAKQAGFTVALHPVLRAENGVVPWWKEVSRDPIWWTTWFDQYRKFAVHFADVAQRTGVDVLVLGGEEVRPSIPGFGNAYRAEKNWEVIIGEVRSHFNGVLAWHQPFRENLDNTPKFINQVDEVNFHWGVGLATWSEAGLDEIESRAGLLLDDQVKPFKQKVNKPVVLNIAYPSAKAGVTNCLTIENYSEGCYPFEWLTPIYPDNNMVEIDLREQIEVYNAILSAINERLWVDGIISDGFYLPLALEDKSISIHGKPTQDLLRYWFAQYLAP